MSAEWSITFDVIGFLAFVIGVADFLYLIIWRRMCVEMTVINYEKKDNDMNHIVVTAIVRLTNRSFYPVSILRSDLVTQAGVFAPDPKAVHFNENEPPLPEPIQASSLPIPLYPQDSHDYHLTYILPIRTEPNYSEKGLDFLFYASRSKTRRIHLTNHTSARISAHGVRYIKNRP